MITARSVSTKLHSTTGCHEGGHFNPITNIRARQYICLAHSPASECNAIGHASQGATSSDQAAAAGMAGAPVVQRLKGPRPVLDAPVQEQHLASAQHGTA